MRLMRICPQNLHIPRLGANGVWGCFGWLQGLSSYGFQNVLTTKLPTLHVIRQGNSYRSGEDGHFCCVLQTTRYITRVACFESAALRVVSSSIGRECAGPRKENKALAKSWTGHRNLRLCRQRLGFVSFSLAYIVLEYSMCCCGHLHSRCRASSPITSADLGGSGFVLRAKISKHSPVVPRHVDLAIV